MTMRMGEFHYIAAIVYYELTLYLVALIFAAPSRLWLFSSTTASTVRDLGSNSCLLD